MDKKTLTRAGIIIGIFLAILALAYGCSVQQANKVKTPQIDNPNDVYATIDGYDITNQMLWDEMKGSEGFNYLINYIDSLSLTTYIDNVTDEQVAAEIEYIIYGTKIQDVIDEIQADEELNQEFIDIFENRFKSSGFDPNSLEDQRRYVEEGLAKFALVREYLLTAEGEDAYAISEEEIEAYYDQSAYENACVIPLRFNSESEGQAILAHFDLVPNINGTIAQYLPRDLTEALELAEDGEITYISASTALEGEIPNVSELTYEELFEKYIEMYNYTNPWLDPISEEISPEDYCANYADTASYDYTEMTKNFSIGSPSFDLAIYTFNNLDLEDETAPKYSDDLESFGGVDMMVYKVSQDPTAPYEDITDADKAILKDEMIDSLIDSGLISSIMAVLRDQDLVLYDPQMIILEELTYGDLYDNDGSETYVAKYGDLKISVDTLFDYMKEKAGMYYALEIAKRRTVVYSDFYTDVYGSSHDYINSDNEALVVFQETIHYFKLQYNGGAYIASGVDPSEMSWSEFLYAAFGATTENEVIEKVYVYPSLIMPYINENLIDYDSASDYIQSQFDNYYSMDASQLLLYVDFDGDFYEDDFSNFIEKLTPEGLTEFNILKSEFEDVIDFNLDEGLTFDEIVNDFNDTLRTDEDNQWSSFKDYGFRIKTTELPGLNFNTTSSLDDALLNDLLELYDEYQLTANADAEFLIHHSITISDFGINKIRVTKGASFDRPSAMFAEDDAENPVYTVGSENANDLPTREQVELYIELQYANLVAEDSDISLPPSVLAAIDYYYGPIFSASFYIDEASLGSAGFNIALIENMFANDLLVFTEDNDILMTQLQGVLEATYYSTFPPEYVKLSDLN